MNMRTFAVVLGTVTAACCATANFMGCIVTTNTSGTGGDTGTGGSVVASSTSTGHGGASSSSSAVSSSGSTMCDMAYKCAEAITPPNGDPTKLCDGTNSAMLYDALSKCTCMGACAQDCGASACMMKPADAVCDMCIHDMAAGCGKEFNECSNDF